MTCGHAFSAILTGLFIVLMETSAAAPCDLEPARALHTQARTSEGSARIELLQQAWQTCRDPKIGYDLGRFLLEDGDLEGALHQFRAAREVVPADGEASAVLRPSLQARIAQTLLLLGEIGRAEAEISLAETLPGGADNTLVQSVRRAVDLAPERRLMDAEQIAMALSTQRAVGVSERVSLFILFDYDRDRPNAEGERQVSELAKALAPLADANRRILLIGHTDARGEADYNQVLSVRRAESVKALLEAREPNLSGHLEARGRGDRQPRYRGDGEEDHRLNRRVEVVVLDGS